jgi:ubiquinone/menaquinone biosynthesis C-methylase UbiE
MDNTMDANHEKYKPALSYDLLTPLYDLVIRLTMPESKFKRRLVEQAQIQKGHRVLDLGCGTATLTILTKKIHLDADLVGLDGDQRILTIAREKASRAGLEITFDQGMSFDMPYPDASFNRVLSSLMFHHLTREDKRRTLKEVFRVLQGDGELHVADWGKPQNILMRMASLPLRTFDSFETTSDNVKGLLPDLFREAGFRKVDEQVRYMTLFGTLSLYKACKHE